MISRTFMRPQRVKATGWFVENQQVGIVDERLRRPTRCCIPLE